MITSSKKAPFAYTRRVIALPVMVLLVASFSVHLEAQTGYKINGTVEKNGNRTLSVSARKVDHIEIYGETGKSDTATVYFKNGEKEVYILNSPLEHAAFEKKYGQYLSHPPTQDKEPAKAESVNDEDSFQYQPLSPVPETISNITFNPKTIWLTRKDGREEQYNIDNKEDRKSFESKYGSLKFKEGS